MPDCINCGDYFDEENSSSSKPTKFCCEYCEDENEEGIIEGEEDEY